MKLPDLVFFILGVSIGFSIGSRVVPFLPENEVVAAAVPYACAVIVGMIAFIVSVVARCWIRNAKGRLELRSFAEDIRRTPPSSRAG
jgi:uncharacterized protein YacL